MAKLGQQVQQQQQAQQQQRATRSQRVQAQEEQVRFEGLKVEAQKVQEEQFKDKVESYEETYYEYRPSNYSEKQWNRLSDDQKNTILRPFSKGRGFEYYAQRGDLIAIPRTRTATRTIPFTLDEGSNSYENIYAGLAPELKQFFAPPEQLKEERSQRIQTNISRVDERIEMAKIRLRELDEKYQQRKQELQEWWQRKSSKYRDDPRNRENYKQNLRDLENDYEEDTEQQRGIVEGLSKGKGELSSKKDIDFDAIVAYANDLGNYYQERKEARNENREAERRALKELEQRNKEAQAKGFTMTGTITESFVDPKTKKETVQGVRYYLGGAQVSPQEFGKKFDIYQKPSGDQLILPKGTDLSKLSSKQLETLFPVEFAQAKTEEAKRLTAFEKSVETLPVSEQATPETPKKSTFRKILDTAGDALSGFFLKSTVGLGTRGFVSGEPTGLTGDELALKREEALDKTTFFGFTRGELVRGQPAPERSFKLSQLFGLGTPSLIDISGTQFAGYQLSKEIRESGEVTIAQGKLDVQNIEGGAGRLETINTEVIDLNKQVEEGKISPETAQQRFADLETKRFEVFKDLSSKGIRTEIETDAEGMQTLTFTSKALETDLAPASVKLLRQATGLQKVQLISGGLATEALEFGTIGLITGGTGASAKVGLLVTKLPKAIQIGALTVAGGAILANIGVSGYKGSQRGEEAGIGRVGGALLGAGIPIVQTTAFAGGSYVGSKLYTESIISKVQKGGFTKPVQEKIIIEGKEIKYPAQVRGGRTDFTQQGDFTRVIQGDKLRTKIPGTDIQIETAGKIKGAFVGREGRSLGESVSTITGKQAGAFKGQKTLSRALYFDNAEGKTAIVTFTKTQKGVRVDQFLTGTKANQFKVLEETAQGGKTVFIDFNRYVSRVGDPIYVKGGSLSDASIKSTFNRFIGKDQLFSGFADDLAPYSLGRTQQVISISPKVAKGATYDFGGGAVKVLSETDKFQTFASVGSSRTARTDVLKDLIKQISKQEGGFAMFTKGFAMGKRGQVAFPTFTKPETVAPTTIKIPSSVFDQDQFLQISPLISELTPTIRSALATNALLGTGVLAGFASGTKIRQRDRQELNQRILQMQLQNLAQIQVQTPTQQQQQKQQQQQQQSLQQQLQQQQIQVPQIPGFTTPVTPVTTPAFPGIPDFDLEFFDAVKKKAGKKRQRKDLAYVQDFTSKVVGFQPVEVSEKQAMKLARQTQTGFEIRMPIVIKGSSQSKDARRLKKLLAQ